LLAGFTAVDFCPEPVAAARDFRDELAGDTLMLVGDFGGGTSDYSLVMMGRGGFALSDVLAIGGVNVAGDALDGSLMRGHGCVTSERTYVIAFPLVTTCSRCRSR
jgi:hypothetical chaperone protein